MTEEEARKKLCPLLDISAQIQHEPAENLTEACLAEMRNKCRASDCMMWQWDTVYPTNLMDQKFAETSSTDGHCGLVK